jgi:hypothetical protein
MIATIDLSRWYTGGAEADAVAAEVDETPPDLKETFSLGADTATGDPDAVVTPLDPPVGKAAGLGPVTSSDFIKERLDAITVG